jgi:imidazolonepropionase
MARLLTNIGELLTNDLTLGDGVVGRLTNAALVIDDGHVAWVGAASNAPAADEREDLEGRAVVPGFVDSHTHVVFAGERSAEFEARMAGTRYDGGGIATTVTATRTATTSELESLARQRLNELVAGGVTTVEIKSGYDLTVAGEQRLLEIARTLSDEVTLLGAHVVAPEYREQPDEYVALVVNEMLPAARGLATWVDVFCDRGAFSVEQSRQILTAATELGFGTRLHGNQLGDTGGVALAIEMGCASVDHCTHVSDHDLEALGASDVVATLLPGAELLTRSPFPDARRFLERGVTLALATDCNPGTSYVTSMPLVIALAVTQMGMSVDEAVWSATKGGAVALRRSDVGHLGIGARADLVILEAPRVAHLAYRPGGAVVGRTLRSGQDVSRAR